MRAGGKGRDDARAFWNDRYAQAGYVFGTAPNAFVVAQAARLAAGARVLCVADGEGRNSTWLAQQGFEVTAFDFAPNAVDKARALAQAAGVRVAHHVAGVDDWDWSAGGFDAVVAIFVQFAPPALRARMFAGMLAALGAGGLLLLEGYGPRQLEYRTGGPGRPDQLYTAELLAQAFDGHEVIELREYDARLDEGAGHAGLSALVDCVVRKR